MIAGLILAAGAGTRFGPEPKLLASLNGRPVLEHAVRAQCDVDALWRIVVVLGARAAEIAARNAFGRAEVVVCDRWREGQSASLRCGVSQLADADKVVVTLGDQPLITPQAIARLAAAPPGARATYDGRPGHPVVLGRDHIAALSSVTGDTGARDVIDGPAIECGDLCSGRDVDLLEDLQALGG